MVSEGQEVSIDLSKKSHVAKSEVKFPFHILFEDNEFVAFIKPPGYPMRSDNRKVRTVLSELRFWQKASEHGQELFPINKIDKRESGVILAARDLGFKKGI